MEIASARKKLTVFFSDQLDPQPGQQRLICEEHEGMKVYLDLHKLDKATAAQALESILARLRA